LRKRARPPGGLSGTGGGVDYRAREEQIEGFSIGIGHGRASTGPALMKKKGKKEACK